MGNDHYCHFFSTNIGTNYRPLTTTIVISNCYQSLSLSFPNPFAKDNNNNDNDNDNDNDDDNDDDDENEDDNDDELLSFKAHDSWVAAAKFIVPPQVITTTHPFDRTPS